MLAVLSDKITTGAFLVQAQNLLFILCVTIFRSAILMYYDKPQILFLIVRASASKQKRVELKHSKSGRQENEVLTVNGDTNSNITLFRKFLGFIHG